MVAVTFGLFNIITATFVQATMDGLTLNHVQSKYAQLYESRHMHRKLDALVSRIECIWNQEVKHDPNLRRVRGSSMAGLRGADVFLTEEFFCKVFEDQTVQALLDDLDIKIDHRLTTFQEFDISKHGRVSLMELIQRLMKMRGEPQKSDQVVARAMLEEIRSQFHEFQRTCLSNQKELSSIQAHLFEEIRTMSQPELSLTRSGMDAAACHAPRSAAH